MQHKCAKSGLKQRVVALLQQIQTALFHVDHRHLDATKAGPGTAAVTLVGKNEGRVVRPAVGKIDKGPAVKGFQHVQQIFNGRHPAADIGIPRSARGRSGGIKCGGTVTPSAYAKHWRVKRFVGILCADARRRIDEFIPLRFGPFDGILEAVAVRPLLQDGRNSGLQLVVGGVGAEAGERGGQCAGLAGGFPEVAHGAAAPHVGQARDPAGVQRVGELAVEDIGTEIDVA